MVKNQLSLVKSKVCHRRQTKNFLFPEILYICFDCLSGPDLCASSKQTLCPHNSLCINTLGSYTCVCQHGYYDVSSVIEPPVASHPICNGKLFQVTYLVQWKNEYVAFSQVKGLFHVKWCQTKNPSIICSALGPQNSNTEAFLLWTLQKISQAFSNCMLRCFHCGFSIQLQWMFLF